MNVHSYRYWSIERGGNVMRLGAIGSDGYERFIMLDADMPAKDFRKMRNGAFDLLDERVDEFPPGEITLTEDVYGFA